MFLFGASELLVILVIVVFLYGGKRLSQIGGDLGKSITEFKKAIGNDPPSTAEEQKKVEAGKER